MNVHHRRALFVLLATLVLDLILGVAYGYADHIGVSHGLYCATATATTVGCDVVPATGPAYVLSLMMMVTIVPLFASVFAFFTSGLTSDHVDKTTAKQTNELKGHVSDIARNAGP